MGYLERLVVDINTFTLESRRNLRQMPGPYSAEFTTINAAYTSRKYKYVYFVKNAFLPNSAIIKVGHFECVTFDKNTVYIYMVGEIHYFSGACLLKM